MQSVPINAPENVHDQLNKGGIIKVPDCWNVQANQLDSSLGVQTPCTLS